MAVLTPPSSSKLDKTIKMTILKVLTVDYRALVLCSVRQRSSITPKYENTTSVPMCNSCARPVA